MVVMNEVRIMKHGGLFHSSSALIHEGFFADPKPSPDGADIGQATAGSVRFADTALLSTSRIVIRFSPVYYPHSERVSQVFQRQ